MPNLKNMSWTGGFHTSAQNFELLAVASSQDCLNSDFIYTLTCRCQQSINPLDFLQQSGVLRFNQHYRHGFIHKIIDEGRDEAGLYYWTIELIAPLARLQYQQINHLYPEESVQARVETWVKTANLAAGNIRISPDIRHMMLPCLTTYGQNLQEVWANFMANQGFIWFYEFSEQNWLLQITRELPTPTPKKLSATPQVYRAYNSLETDLIWQTEVLVIDTQQTWVNPGECVQLIDGQQYRVLATELTASLLTARQAGERMPVKAAAIDYWQKIWLCALANPYRQPTVESQLWHDMPNCFIAPSVLKHNHWQLAKLVGDAQDSHQIHYHFDQTPVGTQPQVPLCQPSAQTYLPNGAGVTVCVGLVAGDYSQPIIMGCLPVAITDQHRIELDNQDTFAMSQSLLLKSGEGESSIELLREQMTVAIPRGGFINQARANIHLASQDYVVDAATINIHVQSTLKFLCQDKLALSAPGAIQWSASGGLQLSTAESAHWSSDGGWQQIIGATWQLTCQSGDAHWVAQSGGITLTAGQAANIQVSKTGSLQCRVGASKLRLSAAALQLQAAQLLFNAPQITVY